MGPDDCVFPAMGANGIVQPREQLSHDVVQKWIKQATSGAGILGLFSTHCFRRGGAQYRFMFAPVGERWPLTKVRWWGGWAKQEHVGPQVSMCPLEQLSPARSQRDTLIRYLLDELHSYETDYSDVMAPTSRGANDSLMGEGALVRAVSTEEMRSVHTSVVTDVHGLRADMDGITGVIRELTHVILQSNRCSPTAAPGRNTDADPEAPPRPGPAPLTIRIPPHLAGPSSIPASSRTTRSNVNLNLNPPDRHDAAALAPLPRRAKTGARRSRHLSYSIPKPGLVIPDVPVLCSDGTRRPKKESWRDIVKHWVSGDPELGLDTPLSEWPLGWIQGNNHVFAVKHYERSVIALEFLST